MIERLPENLTRFDVPDAVFASDNEDGIPLLDISMQAQYFHAPCMQWGSVARRNAMLGTWLFFIDDYKFLALEKDPTMVLNTRCNGAVEPNFSTGPNMPRAVAIHQIYRKRWIARYWQSRGLRVFVDMNVDPVWQAENLLGVPYGWSAYMTRGSSLDLRSTDVEWQLARARAGHSNILFGVYGGGRKVEEMCRRYAADGWVYLEASLEANVKLRSAGGTP